MSTKDVAPN